MTPISIPWPKIYVDLVAGGNTEKSAIMAARQLERDIFLDGWPVGQVFADRPDLVRRYGFGRGTLIEAIRLLEKRGVARMRRGPGRAEERRERKEGVRTWRDRGLPAA